MANFYTDNSDLKFQLSHPLMRKIVELKEQDFKDSGVYDYAPCNVEDAIDSYDKVMEVMGEICADTIAANAEQVDHDGPVCENGRVTYAVGTAENQRVLTQAGMYGMSLPRQYGGLNFSLVPYVMAEELVSRADAGFANIWGLQDCAETIHEFASEEIKAEFLPRIPQGDTCSMDLTEPDAGSDLQAAMLKAEWNEEKGMWMLNGVKRFITNGDAQIKLVLARSEEGTRDGRGLSYFVHDQKWGGVTVRRIENKLGIKGSPTCELVFKNAPAKLIGERRMGLIKYVMSLMNGARLGEMLAVMKAKLQASRAILYETTRFVDIYKSYGFIAETRKLTPEERQEMKKYQRYADMFTPVLKMMSSEYCNQNAYDAIQIHGGSGYMKEYPVERIYRDARITTIYEGTSQLQTVAAIRYVTTGAYLAKIREYEAEETAPEFATLRKTLVDMAAQYEQACAIVHGHDTSYVDFHARRLVEMAGHIIMGWLLVLDAQRCSDFTKSARVFIGKARAWNQERYDYIAGFTEDDMADFQ